MDLVEALHASDTKGRTNLLSKLAVEARDITARSKFVRGGLHLVVTELLNGRCSQSSGFEHTAHRLMQTQAARVIANLSAHCKQNKAAVVSAGAIEALSRAGEAAIHAPLRVCAALRGGRRLRPPRWTLHPLPTAHLRSRSMAAQPRTTGGSRPLPAASTPAHDPLDGFSRLGAPPALASLEVQPAGGRVHRAGSHLMVHAC